MTNITYGTAYLCALFGVSRQTIANWCKRYEPWLSAGANPPKNRHREYTESDLPVFARIAELSHINRPPAEIEAALAAGQTGKIPEISGSALMERSEGTRNYVLMEAALAKSEALRLKKEA